MTLSKKLFFDLESKMKQAGFSFELNVLKKRLAKKEQLPADEFAKHAIYVVLASGFEQKTAKIKHQEIMDFLQKASSKKGKSNLVSELLKIFGNKNKKVFCSWCLIIRITNYFSSINN